MSNCIDFYRFYRLTRRLTRRFVFEFQRHGTRRRHDRPRVRRARAVVRRRRVVNRTPPPPTEIVERRSISVEFLELESRIRARRLEFAVVDRANSSLGPSGSPKVTGHDASTNPPFAWSSHRASRLNTRRWRRRCARRTRRRRRTRACANVDVDTESLKR